MERNTWKFKITELETGEKIDECCFYGADSEDAYYRCIEWAEKHYGKNCHADIIDAEIERNEARRKQEIFYSEDKDDSSKSLKSKKINIISIKKGAIKNVKGI